MIRFASIVSLLTSIATSAAAEPTEPAATATTTVGIDGVVILPVGDYAQAADLAVGALGRVERPLGPGAVTGRAGAIFHALDADGSLTFVPIYAGYRLPIGAGGLYAAGELGITLAFASAGGASSSDTELGLTASAGLRRGPLDLRVGLFLPDAGDTLGLFGSVGYDFAAF